MKLIVMLAVMLILVAAGCADKGKPVPELVTSDGQAIHVSFVSADKSSTELNKLAEGAVIAAPESEIAVKFQDAAEITMSVYSIDMEEPWTWTGSEMKAIASSLKVPKEKGTYIVELEAKLKSAEIAQYYFAIETR